MTSNCRHAFESAFFYTRESLHGRSCFVLIEADDNVRNTQLVSLL